MGLFSPILLRHVCDGKRFPLDGGEGLFAFFLGLVLSFRCRELCVTIDGCQHPVGFRLEIVYLLLPLYDEGKCRGLDPSYGQNLPLPVAVVSIL